MSSLDRFTYNRIVNLVVQNVDEANRRSLVTQAFYGSPILQRITFSGNSGDFATHLVRTCDEFGEIEPGQPALVVLLEMLKSRVGVNRHQEIDALIGEIKQERAPHNPPLRAVEQEQSSGWRTRISTIAAIIVFILTVLGVIFGALDALPDDVTDPIWASLGILEPSPTPTHTSTPSSTPTPTETSLATPTPAHTAIPPTDASVLPTNTPVPPTPVPTVTNTPLQSISTGSYPCDATVNPFATATTLNVVRQFPNQNASIVASVRRGETVLVIERSAGSDVFYNIQSNGRTVGWIADEHLELSNNCP